MDRNDLSVDAGDLSLAATDAQTSRVNWRDLDFHEWRYWEATKADGSIWVYPDAEQAYREQVGYPLHERCQGPMMNYAYELPNRGTYAVKRSSGRIAAALAGLPLCVVEGEALSGERSLALTGGGMDLSWEICEAYIRLGFAPPTEHADLPAMANRGDSPGDRTIIEACKRSLESARDRSAANLKQLEKRFA